MYYDYRYNSMVQITRDSVGRHDTSRAVQASVAAYSIWASIGQRMKRCVVIVEIICWDTKKFMYVDLFTEKYSLYFVVYSMYRLIYFFFFVVHSLSYLL